MENTVTKNRPMPRFKLLNKSLKIKTKYLTPGILEINLNITVGTESTLLPPQLQFTDENYTG